MPDEARSAEQGRSDGVSGDAPELREELARCREEVLRLRDLLIAKDAELGAARGRLAELEQRAALVLGAAARLKRLLPGRSLLGRRSG